jgi:lysozyme
MNFTKAIQLIKKYEGLRLKKYLCPAQKWTIGYGHVILKNENLVIITKEKAEELLQSDLEKTYNSILKVIKNIKLNENQINALISFVFNIGSGAFATSTVLRKLKSNDYIGASDQFSRWVYGSGKKLPGLIKRRNDEKNLFMEKI